MNKSVAIVLGGTNPHKALIELLNKRGYFTILIDYLENPPAAPVADRHIKESTLNRKLVLKHAKEVNAQLVISLCVDQANVTASYVSEKLGLPFFYSYETSLLAANKASMKSKFVECGIPTAKFVCVKKIEEYTEGVLNYPLVIKPSDSTGSKGVKKILNKVELEESFLLAKNYSHSGYVIIEEHFDGEEFQFDCFSKDGSATILMANQKNKINNIDDGELQSIGSIMPVEFSSEVKDKIQEIADKILKAFSLSSTPFFIQCFIKDDNISIIEFAPRIGGGMSFHIIPKVTGFNTLENALRLLLNERIELRTFMQDKYYSTNNIYIKECSFGELKGLLELSDGNIIDEYYLYKSLGSKISGNLSSNNRVASFVVSANNKTDLFDKMRTAYRKIKAFDDSGTEVEQIVVFN